MDLHDEREALRLLDAALAMPPAQREAWLRANAATPAMADRVLRLLAAGDQACTGFLATPPLSVIDGDAPARAGQRVGAWELVRELDAGGMGVVYLARRADGAYEQLAAIKLIRGAAQFEGSATGAALIARFENERRLLARLDHRNIARIIDGGRTDDGVPFLAMEYIDGPGLIAYCERERLDVRARIALFCKVCDGVQAAHRHLIVHRDLKPQNILVGADGEPRLLDFGIARMLEGQGADATDTRFTAMTPAYASPEQLRGEPPTTASDIYSLGVVLYEMLTGTRPHALEGLSPAESERRVCDTAPPSLRRAIASSDALSQGERRARIAGIGRDLEHIVGKALHRAPERRYGTADALADDLRRLLDGRPVTARPDTGWYRARRFVGRHRVGSALAALALLAVIVAAGVAFHQAATARRAVADAEAVNRFLVDVLGSSDAYTAGEELTLNEALDEAAAQIDARFGDRPDLAAGIRLAIGNSLANRYRLDDADVQLQRGLSESIAAHGENDVRTLRLREGIALLRSYQGRTREAIDRFVELIAALEAAGMGDEPLYAIALNDLAHVYLNEGDYPPAFEYAQRAAASFRSQGVDVPAEDRASILSNLAQALDGLGRPEEAVAPYEEALTLQRQVFPGGSPNEAILLNNLALLNRNLGDRERSLELLQASARMRQQLLAPDHPLIVRALTNVARQALELDRVELALANAQAAVTAADAAFAEPHLHQVQAIAALADAQWRSGQHIPARMTLDRALALWSRLPEPGEGATAYLRQLHETLCGGADAHGASACAPSPLSPAPVETP